MKGHRNPCPWCNGPRPKGGPCPRPECIERLAKNEAEEIPRPILDGPLTNTGNGRTCGGGRRVIRDASGMS